MPQFETHRELPFEAGAMFDLVADVESYPEFVPLCQKLIVKERKQLEDGRQSILAEMTVAYKMLKETFTSRVLLDKDNLKIDVYFVSGPFKTLTNHWKFAPIEAKSCTIDFHLAYEFKSRALAFLMGGMFDRAFRHFSQAFVDRAYQLSADKNDLKVV